MTTILSLLQSMMTYIINSCPVVSQPTHRLRIYCSLSSDIIVTNKMHINYILFTNCQTKN